MDPITLAIIVVAVVFFAFLVLVEDAFEKLTGTLLRPFFRRVGLETGSGPLVATATQAGDSVAVTVENRGQHRIKLASVEGRDGGGGRCFPLAVLDSFMVGSADENVARKAIAGIALEPGAPRSLYLDPRELADLGCRSLAIIDGNGKTWPVEGFSGA